MTIADDLSKRCGSKCELCSSAGELIVMAVDAGAPEDANTCAMICRTCNDQIQDPSLIDINHWRCLNDSIWSQTPAVQVVAWRMLNQIDSDSWSQDLLQTVYLEDQIREWAEAGLANDEGNDPSTVDSNGTALQKGDTVTLIKDLVVKGGGFTAKRGTTVKNIALTSNPNHVEGRVNGTQIVLVSAFLKKVV